MIQPSEDRHHMNLEATLSALAQAMDAHREMLAQGWQPQEAESAATRNLSPRVELVWNVLLAARRIAGLELEKGSAERLLRRLGKVDIPTLAAWVIRLENLPPDHPDWLTVLESLTVHETYFMRDPEQLDMLRRVILPQFIGRAARSGTRQLRIWSAGCSTGEEIYSVAMLLAETLVEAGEAEERDGRLLMRSDWSLQLVGGDLTPGCLTIAEAGIYPTGPFSAFRAMSSAHLRFVPEMEVAGMIDPTRRRVREDIRRMTQFARCNLARDPVPAVPYDLILCRNVLIYFMPDARLRAQNLLRASLRPGGILLLGVTDRLADSKGWQPIWHRDAVAYQRRGDLE